MTRIIKFKVRHISSGKIIGYEMLFPTDVKNTNYEWASSADGKNWQAGIVLGSGLQREQMTGLLDKNGKEIYEGDICKCLFQTDLGVVAKVGEMKWISSAARFVIDSHLNSFWNPKDNLAESPEIIGNIYENPTLLNQ